jgi:hypothetical protein
MQDRIDALEQALAASDNDEDADESTDRASPQAISNNIGEPFGPNVAANIDINSIDTGVHTATISGGGYAGRAQRIGSSADDPDYVPGSASIATIGGGYDNLNNQLAGTIAGGAHHALLGAGDHGSIGGGSTNIIAGGSYSTIAGGGGSARPQVINGTRSTISGGGGNRITAAFAVIAGGVDNTVTGKAGSVAGGRENIVAAENAIAAGRANVVRASAVDSFTAGYLVQTDVPGSLNISGRGQYGQSLVFNLNDSVAPGGQRVLRAARTGATAHVPADTVWSGDVRIAAVTASGAAASYRLTFTVSSTAVLYSEIEPLVDAIGLGMTPVTLRIDPGDASFDLIAANAAAEPVTWNATVVVSEVPVL